MLNKYLLNKNIGYHSRQHAELKTDLGIISIYIPIKVKDVNEIAHIEKR